MARDALDPGPDGSYPNWPRRPLTRFRARDTRREDAARARAVALAGLERARWVEAAAAAELAGEAEVAA